MSYRYTRRYVYTYVYNKSVAGMREGDEESTMMFDARVLRGSRFARGCLRAYIIYTFLRDDGCESSLEFKPSSGKSAGILN